MISIFQENTTKLSNIVKQDPYYYDPLAHLKSCLEWTEIEGIMFQEMVKFDFAEAYQKNGMLTEAQFNYLTEGTARNVGAAIIRTIRNLIRAIRDLLVNGFRKLKTFVEDKMFASTVKQFSSADLSGFKISVRKMSISAMEEVSKPGSLYSAIASKITIFGDIASSENFAQQYDHMDNHQINQDMNINKSEAAKNNPTRKFFEKMAGIAGDGISDDELVKKTINTLISTESEEINGINNNKKQEFVHIYDISKKAINYALIDSEKIERNLSELEKSFERNMSQERKDMNPDGYQNTSQLLSDVRKGATLAARIIVIAFKDILGEVKRVMIAGVKFANGDTSSEESKKEEKKEKATQESALFEASKDDEDGISTDNEEMSEEEEIKEFAKNDESEYEQFLELFDHTYNSGNISGLYWPSSSVGWRTKKDIRLFNKHYEINIKMQAYSKDDGITKEQELSYQDFCNTELEKMNTVKNLLSSYSTSSKIRFTPTTLLFNRDGSYALLCDDNQEPDEGIAVCLYPKEAIVSQDEYL